MSGWFRLTKSKFQIFTIFFNSSHSSKFFQFFQLFPLPNFSNFPFFSITKFFLISQNLPFSLNLFLPRAVVFFNKMIVRRTKILLFFQILAVVCSCDWSWKFDRSWSGPRQKFLGFSKFWHLFAAGKSWDCFSFKLPKISKFWKSCEFLSKWKKFEKLENFGRPNFVE